MPLRLFPSGMMHTMRITCLGLPRALLCLLIGASLLASSGCVRNYRVEIQQGNVVSAEQIDAKLQDIAGQYEDSDSAIAYYKQDANFMQSLRAMVLEEQVVQHCLSKASRENEALSFEELTAKAPNNQG